MRDPSFVFTLFAAGLTRPAPQPPTKTRTPRTSKRAPRKSKIYRTDARPRRGSISTQVKLLKGALQLGLEQPPDGAAHDAPRAVPPRAAALPLDGARPLDDGAREREHVRARRAGVEADAHAVLALGDGGPGDRARVDAAREEEGGERAREAREEGDDGRGEARGGRRGVGGERALEVGREREDGGVDGGELGAEEVEEVGAEVEEVLGEL